MSKPRILIIDIETAPIEAYVWKLFDENIGLNQIKNDWYILSFAAKWFGEDKIIYKDLRHKKNKSNDKELVKDIWKLLDEADYVVGQNSKRFDVKKINARIAKYKMNPPSPYKQIDTHVIAKKYFAFTSNKLAWLTDLLCPDNKKREHKKFPGFELWRQCLANNIEAFKEMELYNKQDVVSTEAVYNVLKKWDTSIDFNVYYDEGTPITCSCGSTDFIKRGYYYSKTGKFRRYTCTECGWPYKDPKNLLSKERRAALPRKAS